MKNILKNRFIGGITLGAVAALAFLAGGCKEKQDMGPEEVVTAFNKAMAAGDFRTARSLCDTVAMEDYLNNYIGVWEILQFQDSSALAIASTLLSEAEFRIDKVAKEDEARAVYYTLEGNGVLLRRKAIVRKERGEWRVEQITDKI